MEFETLQNLIWVKEDEDATIARVMNGLNCELLMLLNFNNTLTLTLLCMFRKVEKLLQRKKQNHFPSNFAQSPWSSKWGDNKWF